MGTRTIRRRLIIMRHAKSSWKDKTLVDHERPLKKRGRRSAEAVGAELVRLGWTPLALLSSDAERTRETARRMGGSIEVEPSFHRSLYLGGIDELRSAVASLPPNVHTALVLGHNPGWDEAVTWLTGGDEELKTADAALLTGHGRTWASALARPHTWALTQLVRSRSLI